jgi:cytochrome c-type biogenesis protein CcmH
MKTWLLWIGPFALLVVAAGGVALFYRRRPAIEPVELSTAEREKLDRLLAQEGDEPGDRSARS